MGRQATSTKFSSIRLDSAQLGSAGITSSQLLVRDCEFEKDSYLSSDPLNCAQTASAKTVARVARRQFSWTSCELRSCETRRPSCEALSRELGAVQLRSPQGKNIFLHVSCRQIDRCARTFEFQFVENFGFSIRSSELGRLSRLQAPEEAKRKADSRLWTHKAWKFSLASWPLTSGIKTPRASPIGDPTSLHKLYLFIAASFSVTFPFYSNEQN